MRTPVWVVTTTTVLATSTVTLSEVVISQTVKILAQRWLVAQAMLLVHLPSVRHALPDMAEESEPVLVPRLRVPVVAPAVERQGLQALIVREARQQDQAPEADMAIVLLAPRPDPQAVETLQEAVQVPIECEIVAPVLRHGVHLQTDRAAEVAATVEARFIAVVPVEAVPLAVPAAEIAEAAEAVLAVPLVAAVQVVAAVAEAETTAAAAKRSAEASRFPCRGQVRPRQGQRPLLLNSRKHNFR